MIRIAGVNVPENKRVVVALTYIEGIGLSSAKKILKKLSIDPDQRMKDIVEGKVEQLRQIVEKEYEVEGELRVNVSEDIKRLKAIGTYRGSRHIKGLPVHGQRTKTNARTKRGRKVTVGSGRKKSSEKT